jgi:hypothetical protein
MLLANLAGFLVIVDSPWDQPTARLWAMMCLAAGALGGFLFGVPKVNSGPAVPGETLRPNSNIEVVSDWLTKIIVGVGLVEFRKLGTLIKGVAQQLGQSLTPSADVHLQSNAASFAEALILYFFAAGMIQGYLLTRMYIGVQFGESDSSGQKPKVG